MSLKHLVYLFVLFGSHEALAKGCKKVKPKLIIDHDGGADDSMAIFMSLLYEKYFDGPQILGLNTVHGNVPEDQAFENTQRILGIAKRRDVSIYRGSKYSLVINEISDHYFGYDGLGDNATVQYEPIKAAPLSAVQALIKYSKEYEGQLVVLAIGALTNIALAISLDPGFLGRLSHLYVGAGNVFKFNANMDVEGYHIVSKNAIYDKVTVLPFSQVRDSLVITKVSIYRGSKHSLVINEISDHYFGYDGLGDNATVQYEPIEAAPLSAVQALIKYSKEYEDENHTDVEFNANMDVEAYHIVSKNAIYDKVTVLPFSQVLDSLVITKEWRKKVLGVIPTEIMRAQNVFEQISLETSKDWIQLDPVVTAVVLNHQVAELVIMSENSIILCGNQRGINTNNFSSNEPNVKLIYSYNKEEYKKILIDIFSAELREMR